jgi:hypothetical protein
MKLILQFEYYPEYWKVSGNALLIFSEVYITDSFSANNKSMPSLYIGLENLVLTYINAINSGDLPCMENAVQALV